MRGVVLQEEPLNLDLLQLMIPLMAFFPFALWGLLRRPNLTLEASVALYVAARWFDWNFRVYPDQELDLHSALLADADGAGRLVRRDRRVGRALHGLSWLRCSRVPISYSQWPITLMRHSPALAV